MAPAASTLLLPLLVACAFTSSTVTASSTHGRPAYWSTEEESGFFPPQKAQQSCLHPSVAPLCAAMREAPSDSAALAAAAEHLDLAALRRAPQAEREDAHHWLTLAACRLGANANPSGARGKGPVRVPEAMADPLLALSASLRRAPSLGYAAMVLDSCVRHSPRPGEAPARADWVMQRGVTSARTDGAAVAAAERGFYAAHCAVEDVFVSVKAHLDRSLAAAEGLGAVQPLQADRVAALADHVVSVAYFLRQAVPVLKHIRRYIHPEEFAPLVRPFLKCGDPQANGVVFEGTEGETVTIETAFKNITVTRNEPISLRGPTGAMTTTMAFVDAALGISGSMDSDPQLRATMEDFRQYHPVEHARRVAEVRASGGIRSWALTCNETLGERPPIGFRTYALHGADAIGSPAASDLPLAGTVEAAALPRACGALVDAYDDAIAAATEWRMAHVDHVLTFVVEYGGPNIRASTGTGGTSLSGYLCRSAMGTALATLRPYARSAPSVALPTLCAAQCVLERDAGSGLENGPACRRLWNTFDRMSIDATFQDRYPSPAAAAAKGVPADKAAPPHKNKHSEL